MKITDVRTILLTGPSTNDPFMLAARKRRSAAFVEVHTDTGLTGVGETYAGYFCPELIPPIVEYFKPILLGKGVHNIDLLWREMYACENFWCRGGLGLIALTGIEAALWDLKGKLHNLPVYELLGGRKHDRIFAYATGGPANYPVDNLFRKIESYLSLGFKSVKLGACEFYEDGGGGEYYRKSLVPHIAAEIEVRKLENIKKRFGDDVVLCLDGHMNNPGGGADSWPLDTAKAVLKALEGYNLFFFEEPLHYNLANEYAELCRSTSVTVAGGECLAGAHEWKLYAEKDCFDMGQPDASFVGGLGEFMKIAALLASRGRRIATHSWSAGAGFMQNIHAAFAAENTAILEIAPAYGPLHSEIIGESFRLKDGYVYPPDKPGLGIELSEAVKAKYPFQPGSGEFNSVPGKVLVD
ncbi:MAG: mandelate racemase/muconate lactonizing enzyme family protein [Clostridia bacterium]|nr:mandelate racemase/muconate lactonizing enzyme family protein [Clostridia bacterium]